MINPGTILDIGIPLKNFQFYYQFDFVLNLEDNVYSLYRCTFPSERIDYYSLQVCSEIHHHVSWK